ncbi:MAG: HIT domain-containing protein [Clostridia bacterium]|nr:HIT domain-containing protein [Clostridia bacterium]MDD4685824.1 HIT domain-containing protein [Clostridia bacterium]
MSDCIFCKIVSGESPCYKIYEDENCLAFLDVANDFYAHTLVIPKKHYKNILDIPNSELNYVIGVLQKISKHYVENCGFDGINTINANNKCANQSVFHLHFHIIPRRNNDGLHIFPEGQNNKFDLEEVSHKLKLN